MLHTNKHSGLEHSLGRLSQPPAQTEELRRLFALRMLRIMIKSQSGPRQCVQSWRMALSQIQIQELQSEVDTLNERASLEAEKRAELEEKVLHVHEAEEKAAKELEV